MVKEWPRNDREQQERDLQVTMVHSIYVSCFSEEDLDSIVVDFALTILSRQKGLLLVA